MSYSTHSLQTCSSALQALQTSSRRSGKLRAASDVPQRQQTRLFDMRAATQYCSITPDMRLRNCVERNYARPNDARRMNDSKRTASMIRNGRRQPDSDPVKDATVSALERVLDPLLELLFDAGVTMQEFNRIAR